MEKKNVNTEKKQVIKERIMLGVGVIAGAVLTGVVYKVSGKLLNKYSKKGMIVAIENMDNNSAVSLTISNLATKGWESARLTKETATKISNNLKDAMSECWPE